MILYCMTVMWRRLEHESPAGSLTRDWILFKVESWTLSPIPFLDRVACVKRGILQPLTRSIG